MNRFVQFLYHYRFFLLGIVIILTVVFSLFIPNLKMDNTPRVWFSSKDPTYASFKKFQNEFSEVGSFIIALESDKLFSVPVMQYIKKKTEEIELLPSIERVQSLANANKIIATKEGLEIRPLLQDIEVEKLKEIKEYTISDEIFKDYIISRDNKTTTIVASWNEMSEGEDKLISQIKEIVEERKPDGVKLYFSGSKEMKIQYDRYSKENIEKFIPIIALFISISILIIFRSLPKLFIILIVVGMSIVWALGIYSLLDYTLNVITGMLPALVLILSIADSIHIIEYYYENQRLNKNKKEVYIQTLNFISIPCLITSLTTSLAMFSLATSPIMAVRTFGIGSAIGIMCAYIISIIVVPISLLLLPERKAISQKENSMWPLFLKRIAFFNERRYKPILFSVALLLIFFLIGFIHLNTETNDIEYFPKKSLFRKATEFINKKLGWTVDIEVLLEGGEDEIKEPNILKRMEALSKEISNLPDVKKVISLPDYIKKINRTLMDCKQEEYRIPDTKEMVAQELFLFTLSDEGRKNLESIVNTDYSKSRISVKLPSASSEKIVRVCKIIEQKAKDIFSDTDIKIFITGGGYLFSILDIYLVESQIKSFSLAFVLVIGFMFIMFKSLRYGLLSIMPNLVPIVLITGFMGWLNISLNVGTVMVASVALGIAVDDTIHFISRFRKERGGLITEDLRKTLVHSGKAIISTSVINMVGFSILLLSSFKPTGYFGILIALTMFFALIGDIIFLPASILMACKFLKKC